MAMAATRPRKYPCHRCPFVFTHEEAFAASWAFCPFQVDVQGVDEQDVGKNADTEDCPSQLSKVEAETIGNPSDGHHPVC